MPKESLPQKEKRKKSKIWPVLISGLVIIGVGTTIYLNRQYIGKLVVEVPVLNKIFKVEAENPYDNISKDQLIKERDKLQETIKSLENQLIEEEQAKVLLEEKIETLKQYETQYSDFLAQKEAWDTEIAKANPELFMEQFEKMNPELANNIYKDLIVTESMNKEQKKYANVVAEMEADQAAKALEKLIATDPELIKLLFKAMNEERQAAILSAMESQYAAQVIKLISP